MYAICMTLICNILGYSIEIGIATFYVLVSSLYAFAKFPGDDSIAHFFQITKQIFVPPNTIAFSEILVADAFTSLSKVFKDFGVTIVVIYSKFMGLSPVHSHDSGMLLVAILASLPFL